MGQDKFSRRLLRWYEIHGRHDLPWQAEPTPYRVWVSEIMLQQTQVNTVIPYYQRFMRHFPDIARLAGADIDEVLHLWAGLGYYARGRNLHKAARIIMQKHAGKFPQQKDAVLALPGIGRSTAGAILALAFKQQQTILDGNVKRSLCRYHGIEGYPGDKQVENRLWELAERHTPGARVAEYTQAIMDFGATLCTRSKPGCSNCPQQVDCYAYQHEQVNTLPRPRRKRSRPRKSCHMLALIDSGYNELLLFKRPASGIWGGLYSLPEYESEAACAEHLASYHAGEPLQLTSSQPINHAFTHFDLGITPLICELSNDALKTLLENTPGPSPDALKGVEMHTSNCYRVSLSAPKMGVGLPTPVQKILLQLSSDKQLFHPELIPTDKKG